METLVGAIKNTVTQWVVGQGNPDLHVHVQVKDHCKEKRKRIIIDTCNADDCEYK